MSYADIILPLPLSTTYTYAVPDTFADKICVGMRVLVSVGKRRFYTGVVADLHDRKPDFATIKPIELLLDDVPMVLPNQLVFWQFLANYYRASLGEVYKAAVPSALKMESETVVELDSEADFSVFKFTAKEAKVCDFLSGKGQISIGELSKNFGLNVVSTLRSLVAKGAVSEHEDLVTRYRPRLEAFAELAPEFANEKNLNRFFEESKRAKKQISLLETYLFETNFAEKGVQPILRKTLLEKAKSTLAVYNSLVEKGVFLTKMQKVDRTKAKAASKAIFPLADFQKTALEQVKNEFKTHETVLLHGVTSSGKTEIYIHLIEEAISQGKQVLYLVPEIALTTQLSNRLRAVFGEKLAVFHSGFSDAVRVETWQRQLTENACSVVLGARSALFLPFQNLGLVVVDEEHDASYKQNDPSPRYHARNAAIVLAHQHGAKVLLGSATPSVETYRHCVAGKFGLVTVSQRFEGIELPEIVLVDRSECYRKKQMEGHFSDPLIEAVKQTLARGEQVILFQNRRGFAPQMECKKCGWVPRCPHCDVSLTYHKFFNKLTCHYCGFVKKVPAECPECKEKTLKTIGFGTEQVETEVAELFPEARVGRMDLDTVRSKNALAKLLTDFEEQRLDVLVGTQMITKGLDFGNVGLVGILNADNLLNFPDFRSYERAFQVLVQVSGRCGRKNRRGLVMLQTSQPENPIIQQVVSNDYSAFYNLQMAERQMFNYPPYCRLLQIVLKHRDAKTVDEAAHFVANELRKKFDKNVLGPDNPVVARVQMLYIKHIFLKVNANFSFENAKKTVETIAANLHANAAYKSVATYMDVDPE